jgi:mutator protein MutT
LSNLADHPAEQAGWEVTAGALMKRSSQFIPYRRINGNYVLFVQKRTKDAPFAADMFGIFGGGIEDGETPETALLREVREELDYQPRNVRFFRRYEHTDIGFEEFVFVSEVDEVFESEITVLEGQYGRFLSERELEAETLMEVDRIVFRDLFGWLKENA